MSNPSTLRYTGRICDRCEGPILCNMTECRCGECGKKHQLPRPRKATQVALYVNCVCGNDFESGSDNDSAAVYMADERLVLVCEGCGRTYWLAEIEKGCTQLIVNLNNAT